jgi:hypothetical protein
MDSGADARRDAEPAGAEPPQGTGEPRGHSNLMFYARQTNFGIRRGFPGSGGRGGGTAGDRLARLWIRARR